MDCLMLARVLFSSEPLAPAVGVLEIQLALGSCSWSQYVLWGCSAPLLELELSGSGAARVGEGARSSVGSEHPRPRGEQRSPRCALGYTAAG